MSTFSARYVRLLLPFVHFLPLPIQSAPLIPPRPLSYTDLYSSTLPGIGAFFGNRSIVVHYNNKTRITCANFTMSAGAAAPYSNATSAAPSSSSTKATTATPAPAMYTGAAAATLGGAGVLAGLAGVMAVLV